VNARIVGLLSSLGALIASGAESAPVPVERQEAPPLAGTVRPRKPRVGTVRWIAYGDAQYRSGDAGRRRRKDARIRKTSFPSKFTDVGAYGRRNVRRAA